MGVKPGISYGGRNMGWVENRVLKNILSSKRDEITEEWRRLRNE
jgi:hypothetical protein